MAAGRWDRIGSGGFGVQEEGACSECGFPLVLGDRVFVVDDLPFCSRTCAGFYLDWLARDEVPTWGPAG